MVSFKSSGAFFVRGVKAYLNLEVGVGRKKDVKNEDSLEHARNSSREPRKSRGSKEPLSAGSSGNLEPFDASGYRAYVGRPQEWDLVAARQVMLLFAAGLRENHRLVDVGCGALRAGRMLIPYLNAGNYFGVEPNRWLVEEGIEHELGPGAVKLKKPNFRFVDDFSLGAFGVDFDFAVAHSVFSHTYPDLALAGLRRIGESLAPAGKLFATFVEGEQNAEGSGWLYPGLVPYTWEEMRSILENSGLASRRIDWMQPRQSWFVAVRPDAEDEIDELSHQIHPPRVGSGDL